MTPPSLDSYGPLLNAHEMAAIWQISLSRFYRVAREGAYDVFTVTPAIGPRIYSKEKVAKYLAGEAMERQRTFGRKAG